MEHLFRSTLDIDTNDKSVLTHILCKITGCQQLVVIGKRYSYTKGLHIILFCKIQCDICRFCFDHYVRFVFDQNRPDYARNILFAKKESIREFLKI